MQSFKNFTSGNNMTLAHAQTMITMVAKISYYACEVLAELLSQCVQSVIVRSIISAFGSN